VNPTRWSCPWPWVWWAHHTHEEKERKERMKERDRKRERERVEVGVLAKVLDRSTRHRLSLLFPLSPLSPLSPVMNTSNSLWHCIRQEILAEGENSLRLTSSYNLFRSDPSYIENVINSFRRTRFLDEEVNCTEPSPSVSLPCIHYCLHPTFFQLYRFVSVFVWVGVYQRSAFHWFFILHEWSEWCECCEVRYQKDIKINSVA